MRPAADARETDTLYRIFFAARVGSGLVANEWLLVITGEAGNILGGLACIRRSPYHVRIDKIAVLPRFRGRGIGALLLREFLRRQRAEGVRVISAELAYGYWLAHFGFKLHPRYAGLVLELPVQGDETEETAAAAGAQA